jgi:hypothetical protein
MVDCFNRHDPGALAACYAPDARVHPAGWPQAVDTGTWLAAVPVILTTFPDLRLHPRNLAAGGRVTAERHYWPLVDGLAQLGLIGRPGHAVGQHPAHEAVH